MVCFPLKWLESARHAKQELGSIFETENDGIDDCILQVKMNSPSFS
jgi:hypothetical protein